MQLFRPSFCLGSGLRAHQSRYHYILQRVEFRQKVIKLKNKADFRIPEPGPLFAANRGQIPAFKKDSAP